jgi:predicted AlkP superfamily phosphohydrolase/phosphomutase
MYSSIPEVSSVAWSSIITGQNPARHGIYGFMDLRPESYQMKFPNFNDVKAPPFWDKWAQPSVIINVPSTYPVRSMNGAIISGFVSIDFEKSVHPQQLIDDLLRMDYRLDVNSQKAHSSIDDFLVDLDQTLEARIEAYRYLWDAFEWQNFMLVFTATDRLMHFLYNAYEEEDNKYHAAFLDHFSKIDKAIGELVGKMNDDDILIMLSDHGFERLQKDVYIAHLLEENGFLSYKQDTDPGLNNICAGTKAFVLDPARIYLNYKGKYPCGSVDYEETEELLGQLEQLFKGFQIEGKAVIRDVYRKEQIYAGPYLDDAPDLILVANEGFNLKGSLKAPALFAEPPIFTGKHTQDTAFFIAKGLPDPSIVPEDLSVYDIVGIIEKARDNS